MTLLLQITVSLIIRACVYIAPFRLSYRTVHQQSQSIQQKSALACLIIMNSITMASGIITDAHRICAYFKVHLNAVELPHVLLTYNSFYHQENSLVCDAIFPTPTKIEITVNFMLDTEPQERTSPT